MKNRGVSAMNAVKAVGKYLLLVAVFFLTYIVTAAAITAICILLLALHLDAIPIIQALITDYMGGLSILGVVFGYGTTKALAGKLKCFPCLLAAGVTIAVVQTAYAAINFLYSRPGSAIINICAVIAGVLLLASANREIKLRSSAQEDTAQ